MERYTTGTGQQLLIHNKKDCKGKYCSIHNPSNHHMVNWPTHWRYDRKLMERIDPMGCGHPDPDDLAYKESLGMDILTESIHGCTGLCNPKKYEEYIKNNKIGDDNKMGSIKTIWRVLDKNNKVVFEGPNGWFTEAEKYLKEHSEEDLTLDPEMTGIKVTPKEK